MGATFIQYGRFLIDVFQEWVRRDIGAGYVQMLDTALANWYGAGGGMCVHAETCGSQLGLEHTCDLYSCDHYAAQDSRRGRNDPCPRGSDSKWKRCHGAPPVPATAV